MNNTLQKIKHKRNNSFDSIFNTGSSSTADNKIANPSYKLNDDADDMASILLAIKLQEEDEKAKSEMMISHSSLSKPSN
jgi:predicted ATPase